jgi:hypothetical protein
MMKDSHENTLILHKLLRKKFCFFNQLIVILLINKYDTVSDKNKKEKIIQDSLTNVIEFISMFKFNIICDQKSIFSREENSK